MLFHVSLHFGIESFTGFTTIGNTHNAMIHLDSIMWDSWQLLNDYNIVIIWGKRVGRDKSGGALRNLCLWNYITKIYLYVTIENKLYPGSITKP